MPSQKVGSSLWCSPSQKLHSTIILNNGKAERNAGFSEVIHHLPVLFSIISFFSRSEERNLLATNTKPKPCSKMQNPNLSLFPFLAISQQQFSLDRFARRRRCRRRRCDWETSDRSPEGGEPSFGLSFGRAARPFGSDIHLPSQGMDRPGDSQGVRPGNFLFLCLVII